MKAVGIVIAAICILITPCAARAGSIAGRYGFDDYAPQVRLIHPVQETVELSDRDGALFIWSRIEGNRFERQYYDFRIYKGYDMIESTLIFKTRIPPDQDRVLIGSGIFKESGTYTWSVRQRYYGMAKSRRSYASFKVIKR